MSVAIIGGGLAGCECAMVLARAGVSVTLYEMKPVRFSPAHESENLAELVCSNSLRSDEHTAAVGLLKQEMRELGSLIMRAADSERVPAGKALAVDRDRFAALVTRDVEAEPNIEIHRREVSSLDDPELADAQAIVLAAGPLASDALSQDLARVLGLEHLYFYDAIAPIVSADSVDMGKAFWASRYSQREDGPGVGDYLNCPFSEEEYLAFHEALVTGKRVPARDFEKETHFEGCMPIEALADRGPKTLAYGSLKPVGLRDPRTGERPYAILQLRPENRDKTALNLVGCQTKLTYPEQQRVFRMIPGLEQAEFLRLGSMHRNTFVRAPRVLTPSLELLARPGVFLAGQITGVEGYVESAACGLWLGLRLAATLKDGRELPAPPTHTALGALLGHLRDEEKEFQPSNVNFGLMPALEGRVKKKERKAAYAERARERFAIWLREAGLTGQ